MDKEQSLTVTSDNLLQVLLKTDQRPSDIIPDNIDPVSLNNFGRIISDSYEIARETVDRLRPFMGRILVIFKNNPQLYKDLGYASYDKWMSDGVRKHYRIPRGDAYDCVRIAEVLPDLTANKLQEIGMTKLKPLSTIVQNATSDATTIEMRKTITDKWVRIATDNTSSDLKRIANEQHAVPEGALSPMIPLTIFTTPEIKSAWESFYADESIKTFVTQAVGAYNHGVLLRALIEECGTEWRSQVENNMKVVAVE